MYSQESQAYLLICFKLKLLNTSIVSKLLTESNIRQQYELPVFFCNTGET